LNLLKGKYFLRTILIPYILFSHNGEIELNKKRYCDQDDTSLKLIPMY